MVISNVLCTAELAFRPFTLKLKHKRKLTDTECTLFLDRQQLKLTAEEGWPFDRN